MTVEHRAARGHDDIELSEDGEEPSFRLRQPPPAGTAPRPEANDAFAAFARPFSSGAGLAAIFPIQPWPRPGHGGLVRSGGPASPA